VSSHSAFHQLRDNLAVVSARRELNASRPPKPGRLWESQKHSADERASKLRDVCFERDYTAGVQLVASVLHQGNRDRLTGRIASAPSANETLSSRTATMVLGRPVIVVIVCPTRP
jgi:hypothetical protein